MALTVSSSTQGVSNLAKAPFSNQVLDTASLLEGRCQFPIADLPIEIIECIFMECISNGDIKGFITLAGTNTHSYVTMRNLVNGVALTKLCPNLRILDARALTFNADLEGIDKYKALRSYYKLEPSVEDRAGLTVIFNQGGLTLKNMKENDCGITINMFLDNISTDLDNLSEEAAGPEMISNAPITKTRNKREGDQETRVKAVGFDGKPTLIGYLALMIATQKESKLKICLYGKEPLTSARTSAQYNGKSLGVGGAAPGSLDVYDSCADGRKRLGAGGRRKLQTIVLK